MVEEYNEKGFAEGVKKVSCYYDHEPTGYFGEGKYKKIIFINDAAHKQEIIDEITNDGLALGLGLSGVLEEVRLINEEVESFNKQFMPVEDQAVNQ